MSVGCRDVEARITAYLDGDLDASAASALRGHLRTCAPCRHLSEEHARIAGVLAELPPADPPAPLWDGVLARLGEAEKADARRSGWSLAAVGFWQRLRLHVVPVAAIAAAGTVAAVWAVRHETAARVAVSRPMPVQAAPAPPPDLSPATLLAAQRAPDTRDIAAVLAAEAARIDQLYAGTVAELLDDVAEERDAWSPGRRRAFDAELRRLQAAVAALPAVVSSADADPFDAAEAATAQREHRERAWQRVVAYLQRAAIGELTEARR